jgi:hypothetical protein
MEKKERMKSQKNKINFINHLKLKKIAIKIMGTKYISKMKTLKKNEIENNFQIEIMFSSSKIAIKIRGTKSKGERN